MFVAGTISSVFMLLAAGIGLVTITPVVIDEFTNIPATELISNITESFVEIYKFFYAIFEFFTGMLNIFPTPFQTLLNTFLVIMFAIFIWKLVKGGS